MGEVYLARDERLGREVAIKVLPAHLAATPEARTRFEREARAVSSLNHPNICTLYDVGHQNGTDYLVLERLEGETLTARLARGAMPVDEVLRVGAQIADALDRAHRNALVHRDLKPGNVMLTKSGAKLLDFGLARPVVPASDSGSFSISPTMSRPLTAEGSIVGTFQYMAPEQLEGKEADARSDIWALGLLLYEMATARRAFEGRSQAGLIAAILEREPEPLTSVAPLTPPALDRLIRACIAKDPDQRVQTAHDVKLQLQWVAEGGSQAGIPAPVAARRRSRERLAWTFAAVGGVAALTLGTARLLEPRPKPEVLRFLIQVPENQTDAHWPRVSPDGGTLAFLANDSSGVTRIWVRPFDALEARPLTGSEGAGRPFWSPDSRSLAFVADGKLKRVPVAGGPAVLLGDAPGRFDGSWGSDDLILLDAGVNDTLMSVSASGGVVKPATSLDRTLGENGHAWPYFLPDGRHSDPSDRDNHIKLGEIGSVESHELGTCDSRVEFAPPHWVLYVREGTLVAHALDLGKRRLTGDPVPLTDALVTTRNEGDFSASPGGVLAYSSSGSGSTSELVWMDRAGRRLGQAAPPNLYREVALSPDGRRVAVGVDDERTGHEDIWVHDLERGVASRLTFWEGEEIWPIWSPDGKQVAFAGDTHGPFRLYTKAASGVGEADSLPALAGGNEGATDWSRDGQWIVSSALNPETNWDIWVRRAGPGSPPERFLATPHVERDGALSPDGRWLAYRSNETGRPEIYVRSFPDGESKWQVSNGGGFDPTWVQGGREIVYFSTDGAFLAVPVEAGAEFRSGTPVELFRATLMSAGFVERRWQVTPDGQRFLLNVPVGAAAQVEFAVVKNWVEELARK